MRKTFATDVTSFKDGTLPKRKVSGADGVTYVVKLKTPPEEGRPSKVTTNELLGYALAELVGVPVPENALVEISTTSRCDASAEGTEPGVYFGSRFMPQHQPLSAAWATILRAANWDMYKLLALDVLLKILDREPSDLLCSVRKPGQFRAIDFGNAFGKSHWTPPLDSGSNASHIDDWLFWGFGDVKAGQDAARHIAARNESFEQIVYDVASTCGLEQTESEAARNFLQTRTRNIELLVRDDIATAVQRRS